MRIAGILVGLGMALALLGCAGNPENLSPTYLERYADAHPTPAAFHECRGFGCAERTRVSLSAHQWRRVAAVFAPRPHNAAAERQRIARALALMQRLVGAQTGTNVHQWTHKDMKILPNFGDDPTQLDCIDEAVNTWTYMTLMQHAHLLRFHHVAGLSYAGLPTDANPRNTAVLKQKDGGYYAVDPSLVDNGVPPPVMPLTTWLGSWPPKLPVSTAHAASKKKKT